MLKNLRRSLAAQRQIRKRYRTRLVFNGILSAGAVAFVLAAFVLDWSSWLRVLSIVAAIAWLIGALADLNALVEARKKIDSPEQRNQDHET